MTIEIPITDVKLVNIRIEPKTHYGLITQIELVIQIGDHTFKIPAIQNKQNQTIYIPDTMKAIFLDAFWTQLRAMIEHTGVKLGNAKEK